MFLFQDLKFSQTTKQYKYISLCNFWLSITLYNLKKTLASNPEREVPLLGKYLP